LPANNCLRLKNHQRCFPSEPHAFQHYPEAPIPSAEPWPWSLPFENDELVPQRQNFQGQLVLGTE
jgi:hypothetical protein